MAEAEQEQNRSEEPTPFKLQRARQRGMVARGADLGFFGSLLGLAAFLLLAGDRIAHELAMLMHRALGIGLAAAGDPHHAAGLAGALSWPALHPVLLFAGTVLVVIFLLEIVQLRGLSFSAHPLKPDFTRLNPARGLKRLFSLRMLKDALKNVLKAAAYAIVAWLVIRGAVDAPARSVDDAAGLAAAMERSGVRLLLLFLLVALFFVALDQIIVRREYHKQMRMSRRELTREHKEREGEPRLKQRRKQLHADFAKQAQQMGSLPGSDLLIVNPTHVAVALQYAPGRMAAPRITAKGRDRWALALRDRAATLGIPVFESRPLARRLFAEGEAGDEIAEHNFREVADLYLKLQTRKREPGSC